MEYGIASIVTLGLVILIVSFLSCLDKKKNREGDEEPSKFKEIREEDDINESENGIEENYVLVQRILNNCYIKLMKLPLH